MQTAIKNQEAISEVKRRYFQGEYSYEEAKRAVAPIVEEINTRGREIAKKHGVRYHSVSIASVMR
jgi:hypothetical protein